MSSYRIANNPDVSPATLSTARAYSTLEGAFADMGDGVIFSATGDIVAFHERHMRILAHRGSARMAHA